MPTRATNLGCFYFDTASALYQEVDQCSTTTVAWMRLCIASNERNRYVWTTRVRRLRSLPNTSAHERRHGRCRCAMDGSHLEMAVARRADSCLGSQPSRTAFPFKFRI